MNFPWRKILIEVHGERLFSLVAASHSRLVSFASMREILRSGAIVTDVYRHVGGKIPSFVAHEKCGARFRCEIENISRGPVSARRHLPLSLSVRLADRNNEFPPRKLRPFAISSAQAYHFFFFLPFLSFRFFFVYARTRDLAEIPANPEIRRCMPCVTYSRRFAATRSRIPAVCSRLSNPSSFT